MTFHFDCETCAIAICNSFSTKLFIYCDFHVGVTFDFDFEIENNDIRINFLYKFSIDGLCFKLVLIQ